MILTDEQVLFIEKGIKSRGIELRSLRESMVDHVCCQIEYSDHDNFEKAYHEAMNNFDGAEMHAVQEDIKSFNAFRWFKFSSKLMYSFGFVAAFLISTGFLFKLMHWPLASISLILGIFILNVGFLPLYFYGRYRSAIRAYR